MPEYQFDPRDEAVKALLKQAIREWMDEQVTKFGWFAAHTIAVAFVAGLAYFTLWMDGWSHVK